MVIRIIDMNEDCIEHILKLLNFDDLLSVAESNELLSSVACRVISLRFHRHRLALILNGSEFRWKYHGQNYRIDDGEIYALKFRTGVKILRYFGCLCSQIAIHYKYMSSKEKRIIEFCLGKYCSDESVSMTDISLEDPEEDALHVRRPLKSIQNVTITGDSKLNFKLMNEIFPSMTYLRITWMQVTDKKCIERTFSSLKQLDVEIYDRINGFTSNNIQNAITMNPQLVRVCIKAHQHPDLDIDALQQFVENHFNAPGKTALITPTAI